MDSIKDYNKVLTDAKKKASGLLKKCTELEMMQVASSIDISYSTIMLYKYGNGQNLETAIKIIESFKKPSQ